MKNFVILFCVVLLTISCSKKSSFLKGDEQIFYSPANDITHDGVSFSAEMKASYESDTLLVLLRSDNQTEKAVRIDLTKAELLGKNGMRSSPVGLRNRQHQLEAGTTRYDTLYFLPVNDRKVFEHTDRPGPLQSSYYLVTSGMTGVYYSSINVLLEAQESSYAGYIARKVEKPIVPYDIVHDTGLEQALSAIAITLSEEQSDNTDQTNERSSPRINVGRKMILTKDIATMVKLYGDEDELKLVWRFLNQQQQPLLVQPDSFQIINAKGESLLPKQIDYVEQPKDWSEEQPLAAGMKVGILLTFERDDISGQTYTLRPSVTQNGVQMLPEIKLKKSEQDIKSSSTP